MPKSAIKFPFFHRKKIISFFYARITLQKRERDTQRILERARVTKKYFYGYCFIEKCQESKKYILEK